MHFGSGSGSIRYNTLKQGRRQCFDLSTQGFLESAVHLQQYSWEQDSVVRLLPGVWDQVRSPGLRGGAVAVLLSIRVDFGYENHIFKSFDQV